MSFKDIFALVRTNSQGKPSLGFGVILVVTGVTLIGGLYLIHVLRLPQKKDPAVRINTPSSQATRRGAGSPVEQPLILRDELPDTRKRMFKSLETLYQQNESPLPETKTNALAGWIPKVDPQRLPPANRAGGKLTEGGTEEGPHKYLFADKLLAITNTPPPKATHQTGFQSKQFLPRGHKIPIILLDTINTAVGNMPVELAIARDVLFNGRLQLPFGWKLYGTASPGPNYKVNVQVNTIVDPQGREYPINGIVLNLDHEPGFTGYPLVSPFLAQILPVAQSSIATFLEAAKDVYSQQAIIPTGAGTVVANQNQPDLTAKNKLLDGTAQVLQNAMARKIDELYKLYPEGTTVPRGTLGWIYLMTPLDMTLGETGGSQKFLAEDESKPAPNIITLAQQQASLSGPSPGALGFGGGNVSAFPRPDFFRPQAATVVIPVTQREKPPGDGTTKFLE